MAKKSNAKKSGSGQDEATVRARIIVQPRREILDPQGKAIAAALARLGFGQVAGVRAGKSFEVTLAGVDRDAAPELLRAMCDKLLVNAVVEDFTVEILAEEES